MWRLAFAVILASCIQSSSVVCGDGSLCPQSTLCDDVHHLCVFQDQYDACAGKSALQPCTSSEGDGVCQDGVCLATGCGNNRIDPGEMCDDGNQAPMDGCSADCSSNEKCGNGVVDLALGETCDDGNFVDHDGCASACAAETLAWVEIDGGPVARSRALLAYDAARDRVVMTGGLTATGNAFLKDTWEWRGRWLQVPPSIAPSPHDGAAMANDPGAHKVMIEGGFRTGVTGDTFVWDGVAWTQIADGPHRANHMMAYDAHRKRMVLFGGFDVSNGSTKSNMTFEWDGTAWTPVQTAHSPTARTDAGMTYDPDRGVILMFAGDVGPNFGTKTATNELWKYDGVDWTPLTAGPAAVRNPSFAYSTATHRAIAFGGYTAAGPYNHTLAWNGSAWSDLGVLVGPSARGRAGFAEDGHRQLVLFSGDNADTPSTTLFQDTWVFDGSAWSQASSPPARSHFAITTDVDRHTIVMFGGNSGGVETWELNDLAWRRVSQTGPGAAIHDTASIIYDEARHNVVLYGGDPSTPSNQTWIWNGSSWTMQTPSTVPPPRVGGALVYNPDDKVVMMFGASTIVNMKSDLWTWNGTNWTELHPTHVPPIRHNAEIGYDRIHHQLVVFSGSAPGFTTATDTWVYENGDWHEAMAPAGAKIPDPRSGEPIVWNPARGAVTMVSASGDLDTWEWDGTWWRELGTPLQPVPRPSFGVTPSPDGTALELYFGESGGSPKSDIWQLRWAGPHASDACSISTDRDGDGATQCMDLDCWTVCTPSCTPGATCDSSQRHCGDGTCDPAESCKTCPADCTTCGAICGDGVCDPGETCIGDCP